MNFFSYWLYLSNKLIYKIEHTFSPNFFIFVTNQPIWTKLILQKILYVYIESSKRATHDCVWIFRSPIGRLTQSINRQSAFSRHSHESRAKKGECILSLSLAGYRRDNPALRDKNLASFSAYFLKNSIVYKFLGDCPIIRQALILGFYRRSEDDNFPVYL